MTPPSPADPFADSGETDAFPGLARLRNWIVGLLAFHIVMDLSMLMPVEDPAAPPAVAVWGANLSLLAIAGLAVVSILFFYRARKNLDVLGAERLRWSPGWAVGGWFIPLANLVIPFLVVAETWKASVARGAEWRSTPVPGWMMAWWVLYWVSGAVGMVWFSLAYDSGLRLLMALLYLALRVGAAVLFFMLMSDLMRRQGAAAGPGTAAAGSPA